MPLSPADVPSYITSEFQPPLALLEGEAPSLSDIYRWNAQNNPKYPILTYHDGVKQEFITYAVADKAIDRAARYIVSGLGPYRASAEPATPPPTVALFANADTITYFCTAIGILRAGCTIFLVSTRNGPEGVADMVQRTGTTHMIVSKDHVIREVAQEALRGLPQSQVTVIDMPAFEDLFPKDGGPANSAFDSDAELPNNYDLDALGIIIHSSVAAFKPANPPTFPTPDAVWQGIVATRSDFTWTVPSFIEEWARDPEKVAHMRRMRGVMFGGAPLNEEVGNALASQGVNLFTIYGLSEVGLVNLFVRPNPGMDWAYWTPSPKLRVRFLPRGDNQYEVAVVSPREYPLPAINTTIDGETAYATSDLVEPHPTKPNLWKIIGRGDEQIILSNGEKTNPLPIEKIVNQDPHVKSSIVFGRGKFQNGVLVEPREDFVIDPRDVKQVEDFRNKIWPSVERANKYAPRHSRIFKEMILVASPSKPFEFNVKGLPRRKIILDKYHDEIEALYQEVENSSQNDLKPPEVWDQEGTRVFIRTVIERTLRRSIADEADIFRNGGDSLQATWIRNTIMRAVRETDAKAASRLPTNLVFKAPTIAALTEAIVHIIHEAKTVDGALHTPESLWKYVEKYYSNLPARPENLVDRPRSGKDVVLITGTTGGFGCDALYHLLRDERVERVYAFNRKGTDPLERQRAQFRARGFEEDLLDTSKFKMVEAVLHERGFGIEPELLDEVRQSVTHILHNAWQVNFNLSLPSFEVDLQGARNIVDLAISSPFKQAPTVLFVSSVGIFMNYKGPAPVPEVPLNDPASPFGVGYSESKWITEHVLENVTKQTGVHTVVMRLGQVAGDRVGHWNEKEWFPALVKSAQFQRCLPDIEGDVTWIPGYEAAKAFTEMRYSPEPFLHLVHPHPVSWHEIIAPIAVELAVPLVSYEEWVSALQNCVNRGDTDEVELMKANPALRLLDFFKTLKEGQGSAHREPLGMVYLSTEKSTKVSETLAHLPQLDAECAKKWVAAWKKSGFL
ncbi:hypothetical protein BN946_scf185016.g34 [Trametes cinnabarina]|uniref:Uncharacterized protein n=1 Tax=Pycnoporus cinnabarinus TaxID=5643 RepID=A0A060SHA6_PYCCI|nr:hypothetical protein BN946_scf185016.g34 [Trametes cinnabarina]